ncbi:MAG: 4-(cytidine 5'-diphospho)-2-C-methyl-D-erythritol kinase [Pseudomonadota bacterium]
MPKGSALVVEPAYAKINLFLKVLGRLENGYHHLQSLMVFCDVGEWVRVQPSTHDGVAVEGPMASGLHSKPTSDNLIIRARDAYRRATGDAQPVHLTLHKTMPVSSGIGGGSADAAATLRALNALHDSPLSAAELAKIGQMLGADVPACLGSSTVMLNGVGAELAAAQFDADARFLLLVNPMQSLSTPAVFGRLAASVRKSYPDVIQSSWTLNDVKAMPNDLTKAACAFCPDIKTVLDQLNRVADADFTGMSGSGATCFALFAKRDAARAALSAIRLAHPNWWAAIGETR